MKIQLVQGEKNKNIHILQKLCVGIYNINVNLDCLGANHITVHELLQIISILFFYMFCFAIYYTVNLFIFLLAHMFDEHFVKLTCFIYLIDRHIHKSIELRQK